MVGRCVRKTVTSGSDQGILLTHISNESLCFSLSYDISHNYVIDIYITKIANL